MSKPYNTKDLGRNVNNVSREEGGQGTAGLYQHPEAIDASTGRLAEMVTLSDPLFGEAQSNAAVQLGFKRIGDAPEGSIKHLDAVSAAAATQKGDDMRGISARLAALEGVADRNKELETEIEHLRKAGANDTSPAGEAGYAAKVSAVDQTVLRGQGDEDVTDVAGDAPDPSKESLANPAPLATQAVNPADATSNDQSDEDSDSEGSGEQVEGEGEKPLGQQNTTELEATAKVEGVELTAEHDTKAKIREAIVAKREESENN